MFGFSKRKIKRPDTCPVPEEMRIWIEDAFMILLDLFGREQVLHRKVLIPHFNDFPVRYDGSEASAFKTLEVIARQMEIVYENIHLEFYDDGPQQIGTGNMLGYGLFTSSRDNKTAAGLYWGKDEQGRYIVSLSKSRLKQPEAMVAVLAHELAHIKLLGEERMDHVDEYMTDLTTVIFGLGVFNGNASFQTLTGVDYRWQQSMGYLKQREWGYALALLAHLQGDHQPVWTKHLTPNLEGDVIQGLNFISKHTDRIFQYKQQ